MRRLYIQLRARGQRCRVLRMAAILLCSLWLMLSPGASSAQTPGGALSFGGVSEYIEVPDAASLDISATVTIEMWIQTTTAANAVLLEKSNNNTNYGLQLNAGKLLFLVSPNAATGQLQSHGAVNDGQWHHVAGTYNQATHTMNVYIDGTVDNTSATITDAITPNTQTLLIGSRSGTLAFAGQMDEIRIWSRELCAGEIQNNKNCEVTTSQNGLVAVYHLDEGIAGGNNSGTTAPGAPAITTVTTSDGQATVSFTPPASNGGIAITQYTVTSSPGGFTASGASSPVTVTGLTDGTPYTFTATATNIAGTGPASVASAAVTPTGLPGVLTITSVTAGNTQVSVAFNPPANNGGSPITTYTATSTPGTLKKTGISSPLVVSGLTNGTTYTCKVTATNANGAGAASAASTPVTPATVPGAPSISSVTGGDQQVTVNFAPPASNGGRAITGYQVIASPGGSTVSGTVSPIIVTGLTNGQSYTFTVRAINAMGVGLPSAPSAAIAPQAASTQTVLLAYSATFGAWIDVVTGNIFDLGAGAEIDPNDGSTKVPPSATAPPFIQISISAQVVSFDPTTQRYYTYRYSYIDPLQQLEFDRSGNIIAGVDPSLPLYLITTNGQMVNLFDPNTFVDGSGNWYGILLDPGTETPITGDVVLYTPMPTPSPWLL